MFLKDSVYTTKEICKKLSNSINLTPFDGTLPPSPPTERCESDSFDGKIVGTAVLLMTRFFA